MKISTRILLTACLLSTMLISTSEAGRFSNFSKKSSNNKMASSSNLLSKKTTTSNFNHNMSNSLNNNFNSQSKSNFNSIQKKTSNSNSFTSRFKSNPSNFSSTKSNIQPMSNLMTSRNRSSNLINGMKQGTGKKMTILPVNSAGSSKGGNLFKNIQPSQGQQMTIMPVKQNGSSLRGGGVFNSGTKSKGGNSVRNLQPIQTGSPIKGLSPIKNLKPITNTTPNRNIGPIKGLNPITGVSPIKGGSPIKNIKPITNSTPVRNIGPIKGLNPVTGVGPIKGLPAGSFAGRNLGQVDIGKLPGNQINLPGRGADVRSGDGEASDPEHHLPGSDVRSGDGEPTDPTKAAALPNTGTPIADLPGIGNRLPIGDSRLPGNNDTPEPGFSGTPGQWTEGDVVANNGDIVDQEFVDLENQWYNDGTTGTPDTFLHYGQDAPWDNADDPFWNQERPDNWKGYWPGGPEDPVVGELPPPELGELPPPELGEYPPPAVFDPPFCPPGNFCPPVCPPTICLPPIVTCPPVCTPCVTSVCQKVIVAEQPVVEQVVEEAAAPVLQLMVGKPAGLEAAGLGNVQGAVAIEVGGIGLPAPVQSWSDQLLNIEVPFMGLNGPTAATLHLFDANQQPIASIPVELIPLVQTEVAAE